MNYWIVFRVWQERTRTTRSSTALLRFTITLPEFDNSAEFPRLGHHVAELALFISDPDKDLSRQAREGVYRLYQLLLHQRVFGKFFVERQRRSFLRTAVLAIHDPLLLVSQAGLLLTCSLLGEAQQLMGGWDKMSATQEGVD
ncbi:maestro heat-like repeat family member 5 [Mauremys reevesii]|uniref:maestro heat-like repeat family member 5 n=1 Tax=Mauremys reevesii TaxID=260615 RepID=UPI00193FCCBB|nr:maestro heat-like repeat family member 5 [Mauremys reevesii]